MKKKSFLIILPSVLFIIIANAQALKVTNNDINLHLKTHIFYNGVEDGLDVTTSGSSSVLNNGSDLLWVSFYQTQPNNPGIFSLTSVSSGSWNACFKVRANGYVGIFNPNPAYPLEVGTVLSPKNIRVNGAIYQTSDERTKQNIKKIENSLGQLRSLSGVSYNYIDQSVKDTIPEKIRKSLGEAELKRMESEIQAVAAQRLKKDTGKVHYGFLAQDIQKLFPELVDTDGEGIMSVNYSGLIPVLVNALNEQQQQIEYLMNNCCSLKGGDIVLKSSAAPSFDATDLETVQEATIEKTPYLEQNTPNPFNQSTQINYYLPESVQSAYLCFYDLQGKQLKQIKLNKRGEGAETISASQFSAGMYIYALIADGKDIDTKRMILTE